MNAHLNPASPTLWQHRDFLKLWTGQTISKFGSQITSTAIQLTALLALSASPVQMGLLAATMSAPVLIFGLLAGLWVDRLRRRPIMIAADLLRAILLVSIPLAALLGRLRIEQLLLVAPVAAILTVFFDVASQTYLPTLVGRDHILDANGKLSLSGSLSEVAGAGVAGILVQLLTAPAAILIDAASFVVSAVLLTRIRLPEPSPTPHSVGTSPRQEIVEGLHYVWKSPILRSLAARDLMGWFFGNFFASLYTLYCLRELGMSPALIGLSVAVGGVGSLLGSVITPRLSQRLGMGKVILLSLVVTSATTLLIPLAGGPLLLASGLIFASQLIGDVFHTSYDITSLSVRQGVTSAAFLGRVNSCMYLLVSGIAPLGALVGGLLAEAIGIRSAIYVAAIGGALGGLWIVFSPVGKLSDLPRGEFGER